MKNELLKLIAECEEIESRWDGDESGFQEDQANIADELIVKANEMLDLINELNGTK